MRALIRLSASADALAPLTFTASASMVPLLGAPLLEPLIAQLAHTGASEITLLHERLEHDVADYFRDGRRFGVLITHAAAQPGVDPEIQVLAALRRLGRGDEPILYLETAGWTDARADELAAFHRQRGAQVSATGPAGRRLAVISPEAFEAGDIWSRAVDFGRTVRWSPVSRLAEWWDLTMTALRGQAPGILPTFPEIAPGVYSAAPAEMWRHARIEGPVWIGPGSCLAPGSIVRGPAWIGSGCVVESGVRLDRCVVENHTRLREPLSLSERYVVRNRSLAPDGSTLVLDDIISHPSDREERDSTAGDLLRLASRVSGFSWGAPRTAAARAIAHKAATRA
ncbi:MAG: hypothetical protein GC160_19455 [Acidobacteria bacterium]|nr:hypothetical protein [Acidobacteriota bacterium]